MDILTNDEIDFSEYELETDPQQKVRSIAAFQSDVLAELTPDAANTPKYPKMPFANFWLYFAPGEVTLWAGFNGSGKSMLQGQVLSTFAQEGQKCCVASFEMKPGKTISRMIRQHTGLRWPKPEQVGAFIQRTEKTMWVYDQQGDVHPNKLRAVIRYSAEKLGIQHFAVDSLMKCVRGTDDYNGQKDFVNMLTVLARDLNIHIHLVCHLKKGEGDEKMPTRMDISGSGAIADLVDNVVLAWRNKRKERDIDAGKDVADDVADTLLICDKSRNGEWEGRIKLWFEGESQKFTDYNRNARRGLARAL
jgi:twinkle protein